jgi:hypothetical protein
VEMGAGRVADNPALAALAKYRRVAGHRSDFAWARMRAGG